MTILWFCSQDIIDSFGAMLIGIIFYIPNTIFRFLQSEAAGIVTNYFVFLLLCWFLGRYRLVRKQSAPLP